MDRRTNTYGFCVEGEKMNIAEIINAIEELKRRVETLEKHAITMIPLDSLPRLEDLKDVEIMDCKRLPRLDDIPYEGL